MGLKKKLIALSFSAAVVLTSVNTFAGTLGPVSLTGTNAESGYAPLGNGTHVLDVTGKSGSGYAYAKKIIPYWPDSTVASAYVSAPNNATSSFNAVAYNDNGDVQSYYIQWLGNSSTSSISGKITH